jgi:hypothetical protein
VYGDSEVVRELHEGQKKLREQWASASFDREAKPLRWRKQEMQLQQ